MVYYDRGYNSIERSVPAEILKRMGKLYTVIEFLRCMVVLI